MTAAAKLAGFAAVLAVLFGGGAVAGGAIGPDREDDASPAERTRGSHGARPEEHADTRAGGSARAVRGLAVAQDGLRLVVDGSELRRGQAETLAFRIVDERGRAVRDFDVEHTKRMHVIVARRDLTGFRHLHPTMAADGTWTTALRLDEAGSYRLFADFSHEREPRTLAGDLRVDGDADLRALPAPGASAATEDAAYDVRLDADDARPGREAHLRFTVASDGARVRTESYLGAAGHLVALREGDLAFLHVHPTSGGDGAGFAVTFPTAGRYRLFLQFNHAGRVRTVAFTQEVR